MRRPASQAKTWLPRLTKTVTAGPAPLARVSPAGGGPAPREQAGEGPGAPDRAGTAARWPPRAAAAARWGRGRGIGDLPLHARPPRAQVVDGQRGAGLVDPAQARRPRLADHGARAQAQEGLLGDVRRLLAVTEHAGALGPDHRE